MIARVLRAPFTQRPWRELGYLLVSLLPAVPAFLLGLLGLAAAALSLLAVGLPVLLGVLLATRPADRAFHGPASRLLGERWSAPPPVRARSLPAWAHGVLSDGARWRALVYCLLKLPLTAAAAYLSAVAVVVGAAFLTFPAWWLVWPTAGGLIDDDGWGGTWLPAVQGAAAWLLLPWVLRLAVGLDRWLIRALLAPSTDRARISTLEAGRDVLTADAAAVLRRLERDLHDGTQARLVQLGMALGRIDRRIDDPEVTALVADARGTVTEALAELRDIVRGIHPPALEDGLPVAVQTLAARAAVPVEVTVELSGRPSDATAAALYFSLAELLTNVVRHAQASRARVRLTEDPAWYRLVVDDDGSGGAGRPGAGTGLAGLTRRAAALDGAVQVVSPTGGPTTVTVVLPRGG